ncbi:hypothetical protein HJG60_010612 [Phyllostomus discolor]|uniref:Uncharacterized protein n=1 Tax=Phyllostomus discolor TaxID=89673 RepID=A0A834AHP9_9CHIR|nr:hypothetical protein HJG60_010612 [Phyllostomus discolor]
MSPGDQNHHSWEWLTLVFQIPLSLSLSLASPLSNVLLNYGKSIQLGSPPAVSQRKFLSIGMVPALDPHMVTYTDIVDTWYNYIAIWDASQICVSSLCRGYTNLICSVPTSVFVLRKRALITDILYKDTHTETSERRRWLSQITTSRGLTPSHHMRALEDFSPPRRSSFSPSVLTSQAFWDLLKAYLNSTPHLNNTETLKDVGRVPETRVFESKSA